MVSLLVCGGGCTGPSLDTEAGLRTAARDRLAQLDGKIELDGLSAPVEVLRDRWGIAHIYARDTADLFFAQGFVAAQDRLYQMEIWRRAGAGELAEVFGPEYVERDRLARLMRYRGDMEAEWTSYSPDTKQIATAFTNGVNAFIRHRGDKLPVEFALLDFRPGEWRPEHCLLRVAGLSMVRNPRQEIARTELVARLGKAATERYMPTDPPRALDPDPALDLGALDTAALAAPLSVFAIPRLNSPDGNNNWVVDGTLSATGKPLLASDPHRSVVLPSLRYLVHLNAPGWNVIGSGEPALPGVAIGHNESAGWGFTIVQFDMFDYFVEQTHPENRNRYRYGDEWLDMKTERETVAVRGGDSETVTLKFTRDGPVIWDDPEARLAVSIRWSGQEPGTAGYLSSLAMDRIRNWDDFVRAAARWKLPSENLVYADVDGDIGWIPAGLLPVRDNWSGLFPTPGFSGKYEWNGFRTIDQLPRIHNPKQHYVATANHNIRPPDYPYDLAFDWSPGYRFRRVDEVLRQGGPFTVAGFERLQHDETSLPARRLVRMLEAVPAGGGGDFAGAVKMLRDWDRVLDKDSGAAALFEVWLRRLPGAYLAAVAPERDRELIARYLQLRTLLNLISAAPAQVRNNVLRDSLAAAWAETQRLLGTQADAWRWGTLHTILFRHPLADSPLRAAVLNRGPVERGGDAYTPNATRGPGFSQAAGASYRHILDLADWDRSVFTSTPGQSGQPESQYYDNLLGPWVNYEYAPLAFTREAVEASTEHRLVLQPR